MESEGAPSPLTPAVFHVLLALAPGPLHGYGIMKRAEADAGMAMGPGTIYGAIDRLREAGWVRVARVEDADSRRRRTFALTGEGEEALRAEAQRLGRLARLVERRAPSVRPHPAT